MKCKITLLSLFTLLTHSVFAADTVTHLKGHDQNVSLIQALLYSGVPMTEKDGVRKLSIKGLTFRHSNGHNCDNEKDPFCGLGDPLQLYSPTLKEFVQLNDTLERIVIPQMKTENKFLGDCAAGSCYMGYQLIECTWKTVKVSGRDYFDGRKVADPKCNITADTRENETP